MNVWQVVKQYKLWNLCGLSRTRFADEYHNLRFVEDIQELISVENSLVYAYPLFADGLDIPLGVDGQVPPCLQDLEILAR